jgi:hypothetical protein
MIIPKNISFNRWGNQLSTDFPKDTVPKAGSEKDWKKWATQVVQSDSFTKANAPAPTNEKNWQEWAVKFNQTI